MLSKCKGRLRGNWKRKDRDIQTEPELTGVSWIQCPTHIHKHTHTSCEVVDRVYYAYFIKSKLRVQFL